MITDRVDALSDAEMLRYSRHILHPDIDYEGQLAFRNAAVQIIGAGGLGCPAAMYLAASGVGSIVIHDHDVIEDSNLQRQIAFTTADIGRNKAEVLAERLRMLNPLISVTAKATFIGVDSVLPGVQVILDCSDNFGTRATVNRACCEAGLPLVSGAAIRSEGQVCVFDSTVAGSPCYHCLFGDLDATNDESAEAATCAESGVLSPLVGVIGSLQATETIKVILGRHADSLGKLLIYDATGLGFRQLRFAADPACPVCGGRSR